MECRLRQKDWPLQGDEIFRPGPKPMVLAQAEMLSARPKCIPARAKRFRPPADVNLFEQTALHILKHGLLLSFSTLKCL